LIRAYLLKVFTDNSCTLLLMMGKMRIASETFVRGFDFVIGSMVPETPFNVGNVCFSVRTYFLDMLLPSSYIQADTYRTGKLAE